MSVINRPPKDIQMASCLRQIAAGKLPAYRLVVKTPTGRVPAKQVIRTGYDTYRVVV